MEGSDGSLPKSVAITMGLFGIGEMVFTDTLGMASQRLTIHAAASKYDPLTGPSPEIEGIRINSLNRSTHAASSSAEDVMISPVQAQIS